MLARLAAVNQNLSADQSIGITFRLLHSLMARLVGNEVPDAAAAGNSEQSEFAFAGLISQKDEHWRRVFAGKPFRLV